MKFMYIGSKWTRMTQPVQLVIAAVAVGYTAFVFFHVRSWLAFQSLAICLLVSALVVAGWVNRDRPLLEITETELRYALRDWLPARRVGLHEIQTIEFSGERRAVVRLHSGGRLVLRLCWIEAASRKQAVAALEGIARAVARPA
jgi:hypothetical protein